MRRFILLLTVLAACSSAAEHADKASSATPDTSVAAGAVAAGDSGVARARAGDASTVAVSGGQVDDGKSPVVRALYVNRWASQSRKRMQKLVAIADTTEINGLVIDMKDEFGLNYKTANAEFAKNAGASAKLGNVAALLDTLKAHKILAIARLVVV